MLLLAYVSLNSLLLEDQAYMTFCDASTGNCQMPALGSEAQWVQIQVTGYDITVCCQRWLWQHLAGLWQSCKQGVEISVAEGSKDV